ncbi:MAG: helix-hairpin-helix domain-containing protein [Lachnospira sp.]|nr:helix-hairpin-helix domain-containing protein [Lachnospira sp.]
MSGLFSTAACAGCAEKTGPADVIISQSQTQDVCQTDEDAGLSTQTASSRTVKVYVCGEVESEGVYNLPEGSRVTDAIDAAGGAAQDADLRQLNLAETVQDAQKILVPSAAPQSGTDESGSVPQTDSRIDINRADAPALMTLPGIGEARAAAIIAYRNEHGPFAAAEDIMQVPGIKHSAYEKIRDRIKV